MLYFLRHGQTDWNLMNKMQGQSDIPLNETGRKQAYDAVQNIIDLRITRIISSDLKRAKETAEIINQILNVPMVFDERLRERSGGILEGKVPFKEIPEEVFKDCRMHPEKYGAESGFEIFKRVKNFFESINYKSDENILVVTHVGLINMIYYYIKHKDAFDIIDYINNHQHIKVANGDVISF